jgi:D-xylose transport system permease protein
MIFALVVLWVVFWWLSGGLFLGARNFSNLIRQTSVTGVLAVGMLMVIVTGQIDLSVGSLVGLCGMVAALTQTALHWNWIASVLTGVVAGILIGGVQGALVAYAEIPSFIVTLGGLLVWRGVTKGLSSGNTYPITDSAFRHIGQSYLSAQSGLALAALWIGVTVWWVLRSARARRRHKLESLNSVSIALRIAGSTLLIAIFVGMLNHYAGVPVPVLVFLCVVLTGIFVMQNTLFGRFLYAIGGNAEAARLSGINLPRQFLTTFILMGALSGVAGIIYVARVGSAGPDAGMLLELDAIAACVIGGASLMGGRGSVLGACLGALFMVSLDNGMSLQNVPDFIQDVVKGAVLVTAVGLDMLGRRD